MCVYVTFWNHYLSHLLNHPSHLPTKSSNAHRIGCPHSEKTCHHHTMLDPKSPASRPSKWRQKHHSPSCKSVGRFEDGLELPCCCLHQRMSPKWPPFDLTGWLRKHDGPHKSRAHSSASLGHSCYHLQRRHNPMSQPFDPEGGPQRPCKIPKSAAHLWVDFGSGGFVHKNGSFPRWPLCRSPVLQQRPLHCWRPASPPVAGSALVGCSHQIWDRPRPQCCCRPATRQRPGWSRKSVAHRSVDSAPCLGWRIGYIPKMFLKYANIQTKNTTVQNNPRYFLRSYAVEQVDQWSNTRLQTTYPFWPVEEHSLSGWHSHSACWFSGVQNWSNIPGPSSGCPMEMHK